MSTAIGPQPQDVVSAHCYVINFHTYRSHAKYEPIPLQLGTRLNFGQGVPLPAMPPPSLLGSEDHDPTNGELANLCSGFSASAFAKKKDCKWCRRGSDTPNPLLYKRGTNPKICWRRQAGLECANCPWIIESNEKFSKMTKEELVAFVATEDGRSAGRKIISLAILGCLVGSVGWLWGEWGMDGI